MAPWGHGPAKESYGIAEIVSWRAISNARRNHDDCIVADQAGMTKPERFVVGGEAATETVMAARIPVKAEFRIRP